MRRGPRSSRPRVKLYRRDERALFAPVLLLAAWLPAAAQPPRFDESRIVRASACCVFSLNPNGPDIDAYDESGRLLFHTEISFESASRVMLLDATSQGQNIVVTGVAFAGTLRREFAAFLATSGQVVHVIPIVQFEPRAVCVGSAQSLWVAGQPMNKTRGSESAMLRHYRFDGKLIGEYLREPVGGAPYLACMGDNIALTHPASGDWIDLGPGGGILRRLKLPGNGDVTGAAAVPGRALVSVGSKLYELGLGDETWSEIPSPLDFDRLIGPATYLGRDRRARAFPIRR